MKRVKRFAAAIVLLTTALGMGNIMPAYCEEIEVEEHFVLAGEENLLLSGQDTLMPEIEVVDSHSSMQTPSKPDSTQPASTEQSVKLTAKNKSFKKTTKIKKYTVTLKNEKGTAIKNAKLTLKVKGKTYKAKTNKKGKATFKITKLTKKGKYTATVKYAGSKTYKSAEKKVKLTIK